MSDIEVFKDAYRGSKGYRKTKALFSDGEIFEMDLRTGKFKRAKTLCAYEGFELGLVRGKINDRQKFEAKFKETDEYARLATLWSGGENIFCIDPKSQDYAISSVRSAWACFIEGAK